MEGASPTVVLEGQGPGQGLVATFAAISVVVFEWQSCTFSLFVFSWTTVTCKVTSAVPLEGLCCYSPQLLVPMTGVAAEQLR